MADVDTSDTDHGTLTISLSTTRGSISTSSLAGIHWQAGASSTGRTLPQRAPTYTNLVFKASPSAANELLQTLAYHAPDACGAGVATITITVNDTDAGDAVTIPVDIPC